jgi:integrase
MALYARMYFAALRPAEAVALRQQDCDLPEEGWGRLILHTSRPIAGKQWADSGEAHDERGIKSRGEGETRPVPIPPELVAILRWHIDEFGVAEDGRLFRSERGGVVAASTY